MSKSTAENRQAFLDFFRSKGHQVVASSSLVPKNDSTLLFTNAGMNLFKNVLLGLDNYEYSRVTTSQRCVRAGGKHNDLENVGYTVRHHTFFEMLCNFSFGDYFKHDAIHYAWELLTDKNWFNLPKDRLWVTVYEADHETYEIWEKEVDISCNHIIRIGDNKGTPYASDNFWLMGDTGPCGPCTEIFYDHGDHILGGPPGSAEENGDRYIEIWNIVFMLFNRLEDGTMLSLQKPCIDTGMGLERITTVLQRVNSNYEIDLFRALIKSVARVIGTTDHNKKSLRVIADHIRSCAFLIADGVIPSNENRGYVLRRIIRRAVCHGNMLGAKEVFFYKLVEPLISVMGLVGDELKHQQLKVELVLKTEELLFTRTLERGVMLLNEELTKVKDDTLDGEIAFRLHDTYGFPVDLTLEVCRERNIKVSKSGFEVAMSEQRRRARASSYFSGHYKKAMICIDNSTQFEGYKHLETKCKVIALIVDDKPVDSISLNQDAIVILDRTTFYAESGGQIGDTGVINGNSFSFTVNDTQKYGKVISHVGKLSYGFLKVGEEVQSKVNLARRTRICINHTATHLMHAALREILGTHVSLKGSLVTDKMLRFDFSHFKAMKPSEVRSVEDLVNELIRCNLPVKTTIMNLDTARKNGALALFDEKYDSRVRVLSVGNFSVELCGGTHALRTGDIGLFRIISEFGTATGVRRIESVTGENAITNMHENSDQLRKIYQLLRGDSKNLDEQVRNMLERNHQLEIKLQQMKERVAIQESIKLSSKAAEEIKGVKLLISELTGVEPDMLHTMVDVIKNLLGSVIIVLATVTKGKISLIAGISKDVTDRVKAGELIGMVAQRIGGKGGGRPDIAHAGGKDIAALPEALSSIKNWVRARL